jgi:hypothetical protein
MKSSPDLIYSRERIRREGQPKGSKSQSSGQTLTAENKSPSYGRGDYVQRRTFSVSASLF